MDDEERRELARLAEAGDKEAFTRLVEGLRGFGDTDTPVLGLGVTIPFGQFRAPATIVEVGPKGRSFAATLDKIVVDPPRYADEWINVVDEKVLDGSSIMAVKFVYDSGGKRYTATRRRTGAYVVKGASADAAIVLGVRRWLRFPD